MEYGVSSFGVLLVFMSAMCITSKVGDITWCNTTALEKTTS